MHLRGQARPPTGRHREIDSGRPIQSNDRCNPSDATITKANPDPVAHSGAPGSLQRAGTACTVETRLRVAGLAVGLPAPEDRLRVLPPWVKNGVLDHIRDRLRRRIRVDARRYARPVTAIIDARSVEAANRGADAVVADTSPPRRRRQRTPPARSWRSPRVVHRRTDQRARVTRQLDVKPSAR